MAKGSVGVKPSEQVELYQSGRRSASTYLAAKPKMTKEELRKKIENMRARDAEMVSGIFKNYESPGGTLSFRIKLYPDDPFDAYELRDGERYSIPRGVARHINNGCYFKKYQHAVRPDGRRDDMIQAFHDGRLDAKNMQFARKEHRFAFNPLDYMTDDDLDMLQTPRGKELIEVAHNI